VQAATLVMLGMGLVFVILLGEIDLSAGVTSGVHDVFVRRAGQRSARQLDRGAHHRIRHRPVDRTLIGFFVAKVAFHPSS